MDTHLRRISDLFVEGAEVFLGEGHDGPVLIWMNKLNAFEREEAMRDGVVRRAERLTQLGPDSPETKSVQIEMGFWDDERLCKELVAGLDDEIYVEALNNLSISADFRELEDYIRRAPTLHEDEALDADDPRLKELEAKAEQYSAMLTKERERVRDEKAEEFRQIGRARLEEKYLDDWRKARAFSEYAEAKRTTEIFLAARACSATRRPTDATDLTGGGASWDHSACDHSEKFFSARSSIRLIPDVAMMKIGQVMNDLMMDSRDAGNSDAPTSSSDSSEQSSSPEGRSSLSSPAEMPSAAPGT